MEKTEPISQAWYHTPTTSALGRQRQEDCSELESSLVLHKEFNAVQGMQGLHSKIPSQKQTKQIDEEVM